MKKFLIFIAVFFIWTQTANASLLITEVQIAGDTSSNDFIEIYNNSASRQDISGFKLRKRASTGSETSIRVFPKGSLIEESGYFLWANSANDFSQKINANASSTQTLAKNNSVALLDADGNTIDTLAWGDEITNPFVKGEKFSQNPEANQSLARKFFSNCACYQNLNNNSADFILDTAPTPGQQNSAAVLNNQPATEEQSSEEQPEEQPQENISTISSEPESSPTNDVSAQQEQTQPTSSPSPSSTSSESSSFIAPLSSLVPLISEPPSSSMTNSLPEQKNPTPPSSKIIAQSVDENLSVQENSQKQSTSTNQPKLTQNKINGANKIKQVAILISVILLAFLSSLGLIYYRKLK